MYNMYKYTPQDVDKFLQLLDKFRKIFSKTQYIHPGKLQTVNRKDIEYRIFQRLKINNIIYQS